MKPKKAEVISFKADESLLKALSDIPNRSEFIRSAILLALDNVCPVCSGTGILTPNQKKHWEHLSEDHAVKKCGQCNEPVLTCKGKEIQIDH